MGVMVALSVHVLRYAYQQGKTDQRLFSLESDHATVGTLHTLIGAMTASVGALEKSVNRLDNALEKMGERVSRVSVGAR